MKFALSHFTTSKFMRGLTLPEPSRRLIRICEMILVIGFLTLLLVPFYIVMVSAVWLVEFLFISGFLWFIAYIYLMVIISIENDIHQVSDSSMS